MENQVIDTTVVNHVADFDMPMEISLDDIKKSKTGQGKRDKAKVEAEVRLFFAKNATILKLGNLLAVKQADGKTLAEVLATTGKVTVPRIKLNDGSVMAPSNVQELTFDNIGEWGCPACGSAHGSGMGSSNAIKVSGLQSIEFYYGVESKTLFTVSRTCFGDYVKATGLYKQIVDRLPVKDQKGGKK
jgi:hypothetical protein